MEKEIGRNCNLRWYSGGSSKGIKAEHGKKMVYFEGARIGDEGIGMMRNLNSKPGIT